MSAGKYADNEESSGDGDGDGLGDELDAVSDDDSENYVDDLIEQLEQQQALIEEEMNNLYGERTGAYNLCKQRKRNYQHLFIQCHKLLASLATEQVSAKKGIKMFGGKGIDAIRKEIRQLIIRKVMFPRH